MRSIITTTVLCLMLVLFGVIIFMPADLESVKTENRPVAEMPETSLKNIISGDFCTGFEEYLSDHVGFRGKLISISNKFSGLKGISSYGAISNANADLGTGDTSAEKGLLTTHDTIMEIFREKPESRENYVSMVNHYASGLPSEVNLYSMIIPTQIEFTGKKYEGLADSQKETIDIIYNNVDKRVKTVDAYSALENHTDEYIYFRTDHHWTTLGAYYAYREFAKVSGVTAADISDFDEKKAENFLGYLYMQSPSEKIKNKPDTIYYYTKGENLSFSAKAWENGEIIDYSGKLFVPPYSGQETRYSIFFGGDHPLFDMPTEVKNGRTILVVKDSYANAFMPWLANSFERIIAVDPRSFGGDISEVITEYNVTDVLLMNYSFTTTFDDIISREKEIYK